MIDQLVQVIVGGLVGMALGYFYFAGLWATVQRLPDAKNPAFLALASMFARIALTGLAIYLVFQGSWLRLVSCLAGFLFSRTLYIHKLGESVISLKKQAKGGEDSEPES